MSVDAESRFGCRAHLWAAICRCHSIQIGYLYMHTNIAFIHIRNIKFIFSFALVRLIRFCHSTKWQIDEMKFSEITSERRHQGVYESCLNYHTHSQQTTSSFQMKEQQNYEKSKSKISHFRRRHQCLSKTIIDSLMQHLILISIFFFFVSLRSFVSCWIILILFCDMCDLCWSHRDNISNSK